MAPSTRLLDSWSTGPRSRQSCTPNCTETSATLPANSFRCNLCQNISLPKIINGSITLPLAPYLLAWKQSKDRTQDLKVCGLCTLMKESLRFPRTRGLDVLHLAFNKFDECLVLIATTRQFLNEDIKAQLLCGENGRSWLYDYLADSRYVAGFLTLYRPVGMYSEHTLVS